MGSFILCVLSVVQGVHGVWFGGLCLICTIHRIYVVWRGCGRIIHGTNYALIICYLWQSRQVQFLFVCILKLDPHAHPQSIDSKGLDNVQCVL